MPQYTRTALPALEEQVEELLFKIVAAIPSAPYSVTGVRYLFNPVIDGAKTIKDRCVSKEQREQLRRPCPPYIQDLTLHTVKPGSAAPGTQRPQPRSPRRSQRGRGTSAPRGVLDAGCPNVSALR